ncbi:MAG TPA: response regulator transcription factor [Bacteroidales bacterium]|nr:response regulator transcription factor [Bacteroidales bacterium]
MRHGKIRAVIIEDENEALDLLSGLVGATDMAIVTGSTTDPMRAVKLIIDHDPEILFLDIRMPGLSGFDILNELRNKMSPLPFVVFTTAYDEYAIKAFEYAAFDYLLKPVDPERLLKTLQRFATIIDHGPDLRNQSLHENGRTLIYRALTGVVFINPAEVVFITADGNYSTFHYVSGRMETVTSLLGTIEEQLDATHYFRASRSCIVNTNFLARIDGKQQQCVLMKNEREFRCEISRDKVKPLMDYMKIRGTELRPFIH